MSLLVPHCGARSRLRPRRGIPATTPDIEQCVSVAKGRPPRNKTGTKRKRSAPTPPPELLEEIILDILLRLPVKSLARFKSVCKAWQAIISDPVFIRTHLRWSSSRWEQDPSFIISPHTLDIVTVGERWPDTFSNHIQFYQWKQRASMATFLHAKDFGREFNSVHYFTHYDGLVLAPTDTKLYLFNPATRDAITLPASRHTYPLLGDKGRCYSAGLGLDPRTGKYKVFRSFFRDPRIDTYHMGMEVFTVGDGGTWRELMDDLPFPIKQWKSGICINGFLFWFLVNNSDKLPPMGLLRVSLANETFGITRLPESMNLVHKDAFTMDVLCGELCVTARVSEKTVSIWTLAIQEDGGQDRCWEHRWTLYVSDLCHPMAVLPGGQILLWKSWCLYRYDLPSSELTLVCEMDRMKYQGRRGRKWKNLFSFNVKPYTESLVRITV